MISRVAPTLLAAVLASSATASIIGYREVYIDFTDFAEAVAGGGHLV